MSVPAISVILAACNAERTLQESLDSVRAQTFADFEVLIVDDGSTDDTAAIAGGVCARDTRFQLIRQPNRGVSAARNAGLARSRAGWIAYQDADDVWFPEKLERQRRLMEADPRAGFIFTNLFYWDGKRDLYAAYPSPRKLPDCDPMPGLIYRDVYATSTVLVRRELLDAAGPFDPELRLSQDWDLWLRLGEIGLRTRGVPEPMVRYRRWAGSHTARRLQVADAGIRVLEKNLAQSRHPEWRRHYRKSLASARAVRELVLGCPDLQNDPRAMAVATLRAWKCDPRMKWLRWHLLLRWPGWLGGWRLQRSISRKYLHKCRGY